MSKDSPTPRLVFITGASRSGTTMLARILGNADGALTLNELHFYGELVPFEQVAEPISLARAERAAAMTLARHARDYWVSGPTDGEVALAKQLVATLADDERTGDRVFAVTAAEIARQTGADVLCEQTPRNIYYAHHLLQAFPDAHVVHVVRDPRAVLASQKQRYQLRKLGGKNVPVREVVRLWCNYHPITMTRLWRSANQEAMALAGQPRFHTVRYEDLIGAPEASVAALCEQVGLPFAPAMLDIPHWGSSTVQHKAKSGLSAASLSKWQSLLSAQEIAYASRETAAERAHFGYAGGDDVTPGLADRLAFAARLPLHIAGTVLTNPHRAAVQVKALLARGLRKGKAQGAGEGA